MKTAKHNIKICLLILAAAITALLGGCTSNRSVKYIDSLSTVGVIPDRLYIPNYLSMGLFPTEKGLFYNNNNFLLFFDYERMSATVVCNKPNCKHEEPEEDTLDIEVCNGYIGFNALTFVYNNKLYVGEVTYDPVVMTITQSNLDRTEQKEICRVESEYCFPAALFDDTLYFTTNMSLMSELDKGSGILETNGQCESAIYALDLKSNKLDLVLEKKDWYSANISIMGLYQDKIYYICNYWDDWFTGIYNGNQNHFIEIYSYDPLTSTTEQLEFTHQDDLSFTGYLADNKLVFLTPDYDTVYDAGVLTPIKVFDMENQSVKVSDAAVWGDAVFVDQKLVYHDGEYNFSYYDILTDEEHALEADYYANYYIYGESEEYFIGYYDGSDTAMEQIMSGYYIIAKEDYFFGTENDSLINIFHWAGQ